MLNKHTISFIFSKSLYSHKHFASLEYVICMGLTDIIRKVELTVLSLFLASTLSFSQQSDKIKTYTHDSKNYTFKKGMSLSNNEKFVFCDNNDYNDCFVNNKIFIYDFLNEKLICVNDGKESDAHSPYISDNGENVLFVSYTKNKSKITGSTIYLYDVNSSKSSSVKSSDKYFSRPRLVDDSKTKLTYVKQEGNVNSSSWYLFDVEKNNEKKLYDFDEQYTDGIDLFEISDNNQFLIIHPEYCSENEDVSLLFVNFLESSTPEKFCCLGGDVSLLTKGNYLNEYIDVTVDVANDGSFVFSGLFTGDNSDKQNCIYYKKIGEDLEIIIKESASKYYSNPEISSDGKYMVYFQTSSSWSLSGERDLVFRELSSGEEEVFKKIGTTAIFPANSKYVVCAKSDRKKNETVYSFIPNPFMKRDSKREKVTF